MKMICIDAGHNHSNYDTGATGNGLIEQEITFQVADVLKDYLNSVGIKNIMTRKTMQTNLGFCENSSLNKRCEIANNNNCDLFVSIHCNSHPNTQANGNEVLISGFGGEAEKLANCINENICNNLPINNRGVKTQNIKVLRNTNMPAVLVELGFISNGKDAELIKNNINQFAFYIFCGICEYLGIEYHIQEKTKELETINDIVWELQNRKIIIDTNLWLLKLKEDDDAYWLARKCVNYIREMEQC